MQRSCVNRGSSADRRRQDELGYKVLESLHHGASCPWVLYLSVGDQADERVLMKPEALSASRCASHSKCRAGCCGAAGCMIPLNPWLVPSCEGHCMRRWRCRAAPCGDRMCDRCGPRVCCRSSRQGQGGVALCMLGRSCKRCCHTGPTQLAGLCAAGWVRIERACGRPGRLPRV